MSIFGLTGRLLNRLLLGDHIIEGFFRLLVLIVIPFVLLLTNILASIFFGYSFFLGKLLMLYFLAFLSAYSSAIYYIGDIYNYEEADYIPFRYFRSCFFGVNPPNVRIRNATQESQWQEMVEKIGGPAMLDIDPGFAVLTETLTEPAKVYGQGRNQFMSRHERIYEIVDLREQEGMIEKMDAMTRDGIKVIVENIKFNYRIWDSRWDGLYKDQSIIRNPYPYSIEAIYNYTYNRFVQHTDNKKMVAPWADTVQGRVKGIIGKYISGHKLDDVIAPTEHDQKDPRDDIRQKAYENEFKDGLRRIGTLMRWWDPGEFRSDENVEKQFITNWSADIESDIKINQAYGDAQKLAYEELGRAEAEAELLMSIIHAMDGVNLGANKAQTLQNLILLRTAQVIKALNTPATNEKSTKDSDKQSPK